MFHQMYKNLLARREQDFELLIQIIVIFVIIGFSVVQMIIRNIKAALKNGKELQTSFKEDESLTDEDSGYKSLEQLRQERLAQIREAFEIPEPPVEEKPKPIPKPKPTRTTSAKAETKKPLTTTPQPGKKEHPQKDTVAEQETIANLLLKTPQDLRNAILYQEILGKPLSERDLYDLPPF